jgi:hypothetical protein
VVVGIPLLFSFAEIAQDSFSLCLIRKTTSREEAKEAFFMLVQHPLSNNFSPMANKTRVWLAPLTFVIITSSSDHLESS